MNKVEQLRISLIEWADDRFIPLKNEIKSLKRENSILKNKVIFDMSVSTDFYKAIIYYISGMTDNFAISCYNEIIGF